MQRMRQTFGGGLMAALFCLALSATVQPGSAQVAEQAPRARAEINLTFAPVVRKAAPAVVNVYSRRRVTRRYSPFFDDPFFRRFFGDRGFGVPRERVQNSLGSGVLVSPDGLIVTNNHVIEGGTEVEVVLHDRREFSAEVLLTDERTDLAVLKIDAGDETLPFLQLADSDELEVGDLVLAIGNPFGVGQTVTSGIVSAVARTKLGIGDHQFFIQTDAAINPGNSGGALVDVAGRLVGVNTAIFSRSGGSHGIGFAIPSNMVRVIVESARAGGRVARPWIGVDLQEVTSEIAESLGFQRPVGAIVTGLHPQSPLARAGIRRGDVLVAVDDREIGSPQELRYRVATKPIGDTITLSFWRDGRTDAVEVTLIAPPQADPDMALLDGRHPFAGAVVANLSPALAEELGLSSTETGVVIVDVQGGPAQRIRLRKGDVIVAIQGVEVATVRELQQLVSRPRDVWYISVKRGGRVHEMQIRG